MIKKTINTKEKKILVANFFSLSVLQAFVYVLPLVTLPYLVRILGAEKFGLVVFAQSFISFFNIFVDYGFNLSATKDISLHRNNKDRIVEIFTNVIFIKLMLLLLSFFILLFVVLLFDSFLIEWRLYFLSFLSVLGNAMFPVWYFQGLERMSYITIINIFSKILFTIPIFIFIRNPNDYVYVPLFGGLGFILAGSISMYVVFFKFGQKICLKTLKPKTYLSNSMHIFLSMLSSTALSSIPVLLLGFFENYSMSGYYSAFEKIVLAIKSFFYIVNQTFFPRLSKIYSENKINYRRLWFKLSFATVLLAICLYILLLFVSKLLIKHYLGLEFIEYIYIYYILSFTIITYVVINSLGLNGLLVMGKYKQLSFSQIFPTVLFCFLSPVLIIFFDIQSLLYLIVLSDVLIIILRLYYLESLANGKS